MQKNVVVTGAASGIGYYVASKYASFKEYNVIAMDNAELPAPMKCTFYKVDLRDEKAVADIFAKIPHIHLAVNCAGILESLKNITEFTSQEVLHEWANNFMPAFNALKNEIKIMQKQPFGKIVNMASITGVVGFKDFLAYGAAKASIINMTKIAAVEQAKNNIKINSISAATIDTPMVRNRYSGMLPDFTDIYPVKTCGTSADIFCIVKMLEENEFMTGVDIKVDGGLTELFEV